MMLCGMPLHLLCRMWDFTFYVSTPMFSCHLFFSLRFNKFDIVVLMDGIWMLTNIIIVDSIQVNLVLCPTLFCGVVTNVATQAKDDFYHD